MIEQLQKRWQENGRFRSVFPVMSLEQDGLVLGAGTVLAPRDNDPSGTNRLRLDGEEPRLLTLLSVAYGRPVDASILRAISRASKRWSAGEDCLAAMHLALAGLRKLDDAGDAARRLFIADGLMADGVAPRDIWTALEFDPTPLDDLEKLYNPNEARNPKGDVGGGEWASGEAEGVVGEDAAETFAERVAAGAARAIGGVGAVGTALLATTVPAGTMPVSGTIPGRPDLRYTWTEDEGTLRVFRGADPEPILEATLGPKRALIDSRDLKVGYLRATGIDFDLKALPPEWPSLEEQTDHPQLCPTSSPDNGGRGVMGGADRDYEDFRKAQINDPPTPRGFGYRLTNRIDGLPVVLDDCQHSTGWLFEFKGNYTGFMAKQWGRDIMAIDWRYQATRQWEASGGRPLEWDFADKEAADYARQLFSKDEWLQGIRVEWKPWPGRKK
ncbi:MAG: hypothetical protein ACLQUZ_18735 [Rhizomicrobium sp.]